MTRPVVLFTDAIAVLSDVHVPPVLVDEKVEVPPTHTS